MLRPIVRTCLLLTLPALGCQKPPAETTPPADASATVDPGAETTDDAGPEQPLPPAEEILAKSVEAMGGAAAIEAIESSYTEIDAEIKAQGIKVLTLAWTRGDDFYSEADLAGMGKQQQWKKGDDIWSKDPVFGFRKLEGQEAAQAQWIAEGPMLGATWREHFDRAETTGRNQTDQGTLLEVTLTSADGQTVVLEFDAESYLPVGMAFDQLSPMGATPLHTTQSDFREVAGVLFPYRSVTEVQMTTMEATTRKFEVNVDIPDEKFEPPAEAKK